MKILKISIFLNQLYIRTITNEYDKVPLSTLSCIYKTYLAHYESNYSHAYLEPMKTSYKCTQFDK